MKIKMNINVNMLDEVCLAKLYLKKSPVRPLSQLCNSYIETQVMGLNKCPKKAQLYKHN